MALPSLTKTWQFSVNNAQAALGSAGTDNKTCLLAIKNAMIGFGTLPWTVVSSSNSVTANSSDNWTTIANLVGGAGGVAHSWIVLKQTGIGSNAQVLIDMTSSTAAASSLTMKFSPATGFTGGTTTNGPTAADSYTVINGTAWTTIGTDVALRWSVMQSTDGQCTRVFVFSGGILTTFWCMEKFANATGGTPGASNTGMVYATTSGAPTLLGSTVQNGVTTATSLSGESVANQTIASEVDGVWDIFPIGIVGTTVGARGKLGTLQDIWAGSSGIAVGDTYPATGSPAAQFVQISQTAVLSGGIILPWNNGPVNLT